VRCKHRDEIKGSVSAKQSRDTTHKQYSRTFLLNINQAELTAITPLTLDTNPYDSNAAVPSFRNVSMLNFLLFVKTLFTLDMNGLFLFILLICDFVNDSFNTSTFTACCCVLSSMLSSPADADENIILEARIHFVVDILQVIDGER